jgi:hypothetical protein
MADGKNGDLVMLAPPYIITEDEIDEIVRLFTVALARAIEVSSRAQRGMANPNDSYR